MFRLRSWALVSAASVGIGGFLGLKLERIRHRGGIDNLADDSSGSYRYYIPLPLVSASAKPYNSEKDKSVVPATRSVSGSRVSEIMRHGFPSLDNIRAFDDFVLSYDRRNRTAHWVFEHLTADKVKSNEAINREKSQFLLDESVHYYFRATNEDYKGSGYDRGHLAAAANHRLSQTSMDQTFFLTNTSPQVGKGFNRDAWNTLEKFVRHLTKTNANVYVCTGPLYLPRKESDGKLYIKYEVIGKNHISVPTHFFKVVVCQTDNGDHELLSFVMPNQVLPEKVDLKNYLVPLESIERAAGLLLFDKLPKNLFKKINGKKV